MQTTDPSGPRKYYINVCQPLKPVPGCDRSASVCEMKFEIGKVSSLTVNIRREWTKFMVKFIFMVK